jgi:tetratricopeptide (TPR) repeat protein
MLFDLTSPGRKRVIRVVYAILALLFFVGFVGFGIGTDQGIGGLFDSITGNGGDSSTSEQYEQQIEDAEDKLEENPNDERALKDLVQYRYLSGNAQLDIDESTGQVTGVSEDSREEFEAAIEAWNDYLKTDPAKVDVATAGNAVQAYQFLGDAGGAAEAQEVLAEANPSQGAYGQLAYFYYADFNFKQGDEAAEKAVAEANPAQKKQVEQQLSKLRDSAEKFQKQQEKLSESGTGETDLQDPFGGLNQGSQGLPPTAP